MPTHPAHVRQREVLCYLQRAGQPVPFAAIQRFILELSPAGDLHEGYSERTFQRDLPLIAETFGFTIKAKRNQGYYLAEQELLLPDQQRLLESVELHAFFQLPKALGPFVQTEPRRPLGLEHLRPLMRAAQAGEVVEFEYLKHWHAHPQRRTVGPLLLREFRGRWYVLAEMEGSNRLACFGLDRIQDLTPTGRYFTPSADFNPATYFAHAFGIIRPIDGQLPEQIRLRFTLVQGRYALSYPLHASQEVLLTTDQEIHLRLTVYDTHDLRMELLSYGPEVEVLAPPALRDWLRKQHYAAAQA
ncbi:helix-turn-helix transcriptional regulator [Hymenobacter terricola]|uniref:helix-turn-helix transcriptional regulator n=1 Tax=Hymenobacter terricola TaxID=2819236 RepID=UPI001B311A77|nr:WYL domain-containing protein [Hymenobacter terricola]